MFGLDTGLTILLILCLLCACLFEFINGFHDTANAVATVIYTKSLKPTQAVIFSGIFNAIGVFVGGIGVTLSIVALLPLETLIDPNIYHNIGMVMALLITAIFWNFSTWYLGIPCSSSHTLIGSILGVGLGYSLMTDSDAVNWKEASKIGTALFVSPLVGFSLAIFLMFLLRRILTKKSAIFKEPEPDQKPPIWIRIILIITCGTVSLFHGQNDGQKGIGLIMLILIAIIPGYFALNNDLKLDDMKPAITQVREITSLIDQSQLQKKDMEDYKKITKSTDKLETLTSYPAEIQKADSVKFAFRKNILVLSKSFENLMKGGHANLSAENEKKMKEIGIGKLKKYTDFAPQWVIILIAISLGLGTMIGWKRIVVTIGEKIGKQHLTYAQGASAELVASITIGLATAYKLPVSTTHVLSSGIAGSMVASKGVKNLQSKTIKTILIAWVLTLPVCMLVSGSLFWLFRTIF
jgi:PiT family inorganic phosphate transporter